MSLASGKFRITLYALDTSTGWRGSVSATIYDPLEVGVSERANEVGEAYWVLPNNHPLISQCTPLLVHYEVHRYDNDSASYKWVGAGILDDAEVGENETTFRGIDYMAVFNQYYTPTVALTFTSTNFISPKIGAGNVTSDFLSTIFSFSAGTVRNGDDGDYDPATPNTQAWYTNKAALKIDNVDVSTKAEDTLTIDGSTITTSSVSITWDAIFSGTITAHFQTAGNDWRFRIDVTPPAPESPSVPAVTGGVYEADYLGDNTTAINNCSAKFYPYESRALMYSALIAAGKTSTQAEASCAANEGKFALRKGVTYSAIIHGAIYRTNSAKAIPQWIRSLNPFKTDKFTLGTGYETFTQIFDRVFTAAKTTFPLSRIRYASRSVSGSPYTTMLTWSAGEPPVTYLANTARLEMVARTDGAKTIFGISHPSSTGSYDGSFRIRYNVSSANIDTIRLSFPETVRGYSYSPGTSSVRTHIRIIPSTPYLAGTAAGGAVGINIDGATATTGEASTYGEIPQLEAKAGLVDDIAAELEALRLADSSKSDNTKTLNIVVKEEVAKPWDGFDLGDAVSVHVVHGNVNLPSESLNIAGMDWIGFADGHEELTLELINGTDF